MFRLYIRELLMSYMNVSDVSIVLAAECFLPCVRNHVTEPGYASAPSGMVLCTPRSSGW